MEKNTRKCIQYFFTLVLFNFFTCCILNVSCLVCTVVILLYLLYYVCTAVFTLDAGLLARIQYS